MAKKDNDIQKDEALFEALGKNKRRKRRSIIITVVSIVLVLAIAAVIGVSALQRKVRQQFIAAAGEVLSYDVTTGTISTVVSGSGSLTDVDLTSIAVPDGVEITEVQVKTNSTVAEGDILATVDMASVMSAMADLQAKMEELDQQLRDAEDDEASDVLYAGVSGRVKAIFAEAGDDVGDVMYERGALALLSLDGCMAVDIRADTLSAGDTVTVRLSDGDTVTGTVESAVGGAATILVTDNGTTYEDVVTVLDNEGAQLGEGTLYIHSALRITAYAGTVDAVKTSLNKKVTAETKLFALEDTAYSANYNSLLRTRSEQEAVLLELLTIQRDGAVLAKAPGSVYSVDYDADSAASAVATVFNDEKMSVTISVDESDILSLALGQEVTVSVASVSEDTFVGTLTEINRISTSSGTYSAVVELEKAEGMLSGMTASVSIKIEGVENAILIPIEAVHLTGDGAYVYTRYDEEYQEYGGKVDVVTGLENSTYMEIKSGLSVGDTVYYTQSQSSAFGGMSGFPGMGEGEMPDFGGNMPGFEGGSIPDFGGGQMPGGFGGRG